MKKLLLSLLALGSVAAMAQQKVMRIALNDGTSQLVNVNDISKITFENDGEDPEPEGPQMVDMGLSVKWATYNMGATKPSEYGNFYAYGEIEPKDVYSLETYQWYYPDYNDWDCDQWEAYYKLGATFTGTNYDVAHVKWGDQWRVPTKAEWDELIYNCDWTWSSVGGVLGCKATSRINGNSIFLPAAGNMVDDQHTHDQLGCFYWTSTEYVQADISKECRNYRANLDATNQSADGYDYPEVGFSIRPVYGPAPAELLPEVTYPSDENMVDLGLSVKWASFNLGAAKESGTGLFFCWGEFTQKQYSHVYNYKYYDPLTDDYINIGDQISGTDYDVAATLWGNGWRMPTMAEMQELVDNCTWTATSSGYKVTGPNGNSIFLPACGMMTYKGAPRTSSEPGCYWCGDADTRVNWEGKPMSSTAGALRFSRAYGSNASEYFGAPQVGYASRAGGIQIRPVHQ